MRLTRPLEPGFLKGYVLDIGPQFLLVALIRDNLWLNGFQCFRLSDVRNVQAPDIYISFVEAALKKRGQRLPRKPPVSMDSLEELLFILEIVRSRWQRFIGKKWTRMSATSAE